MNTFGSLPPFSKANAWRAMVYTLVVALIAAGFWVIINFYQVLLIIFLAIILSTAFRPFIQGMTRRKFSYVTSVNVVFAVFLVLISVSLFYAIPLLTSQTAVFREAADELYTTVHVELTESENPLLRRISQNMPPSMAAFLDSSSSEEMALAEEESQSADGEESEVSVTSWEYVAELSQGFVLAAIMVALAYYWSLEGRRILRTIFLLYPLEKRQEVRAVVNEVEQKVGQYLIGQGILCLIIGGLSFLLYLLIGLPYAFILAIVAGLFEAVPNIGPLLGAVPAVLIALTGNPADAVWVLIGTGVIQLLENNLFVPRIMSRALGVRPFVTLMAILIFGSIFGLIGAIIAIPLAVIVDIFLNRSLLQPDNMEDTAQGRDQVSVLRYEAQQIVQDIRSQIRQKAAVASANSDLLEDSIEAIAVDLDSLLANQPDKGLTGGGA